MNKPLILASIGALVAAYMAGRYSAPERIKVEKESVKVEVENKHEEKSKDEVKIVTRIVRPDGTRITRAKTQARTEATIQTDRERKAQVIQKTEIENRRGIVASAMVAMPLDRLSTLVYGASVSKQFIGPFHLGAFAFTDLRIGLMVGMEL